jgi:hypothetical protein
MPHAPFLALARNLPRDRPAISSKSDLNAPWLRPFAPTIATHASLQDLRCTVGASEIPIAPPDRGAHLPRFPSLAAFVRRPGSHRACCQLSDGAGIRNPSHKRSLAAAIAPRGDSPLWRGSYCLLTPGAPILAWLKSKPGQCEVDAP